MMKQRLLVAVIRLYKTSSHKMHIGCVTLEMDDNSDRFDCVNALKKFKDFTPGDNDDLEEQLERAQKEITRLRAAQSKEKSTTKMRGANANDGGSDDENNDKEKHDARPTMAATTTKTITTRPRCTAKGCLR